MCCSAQGVLKNPDLPILSFLIEHILHMYVTFGHVEKMNSEEIEQVSVLKEPEIKSVERRRKIHVDICRVIIRIRFNIITAVTMIL